MGQEGISAVTAICCLFCVLVLGESSQCPENEYRKCQRLIVKTLDSPCSNSANAIHSSSQLTIPPNQTLLNEEVVLSVNITDFNSTNAPYTSLICMVKQTGFRYLPWFQFFNLSCFQSFSSVDNTSVIWKTAGDVTVYMFTADNNTDIDNADCIFQKIKINSPHPLNVSLALSQPDSSTRNIFIIGNVTFSITTSKEQAYVNQSNQLTSDEHQVDSVVGSGDGLPDRMEYTYRFIYDNKTKSSDFSNNQSSINVLHLFEGEGNYTVFVEVILRTTVNGTSDVYFGSISENFQVFEPIDSTNMKFTKNGNSNVNTSVSVNVSATGSVPINVTWKIVHIDNTSNDTFLCDQNKITLPNKSQDGQFNCSFNKPGSYIFYATFANKVSSKTDEYKYTIKKPSNTKTVVTTSTTVVIVTLLIVVVVIVIILISVYISYQKLKNRSTETANFSFIELRRPSTTQRVQDQLMNIKDKLTRRNSGRKVGLVQPKDGEISDVESYGSLTHFADHDSL